MIAFLIGFLMLLNTSAEAATWGAVNSSTTLTRSSRVSGSQFRKGASAPTDATSGTTPTIPVLLFDAIGELVSLYIPFPTNMDKTATMTLRLFVALSTTESDSDTLDLTTDYTAPLSLSGSNGVGKASTQITDSLTVTTANGLASGDMYELDIAFAPGDATNPTASANGLALEFHLTNVTNVGEFHLVGGEFIYTANY